MGKPKKVIWVLQGARAGDNAQARELAGLLDGEVVLKDLQFNSLHHLPNLVLGASKSTLATSSKDNLLAPWPDMVIGTGKRTAPVARWIKQQSRGAVKIVHLGRPRANLSAFDLVIATPQYGLPRDANVLERALPFATPKIVEAKELEKWRSTWGAMARPLIAVAIGNGKYPLKFGNAQVLLLASQLTDLARQTGGSLVIMASPRTDFRLMTQIVNGVQVQHVSYSKFDRANNPYQSALALCDRFVVTSDSISMISEMMNTGKPVNVFELPNSKLKLRWDAQMGFGAWLSRNGILQPPRDVAGMVRQLIESSAVAPLGSATPKPLVKPPETEVLSRLRELLSS